MAWAMTRTRIGHPDSGIYLDRQSRQVGANNPQGGPAFGPDIGW